MRGEAYPSQGELFNDAEDISTTDGIITDGKNTTLSDECKEAKRKPLPDDLPRERLVHDIAST